MRTRRRVWKRIFLTFVTIVLFLSSWPPQTSLAQNISLDQSTPDTPSQPADSPDLAPTIVPLSPPTEIPVQAPTEAPILVPTEVSIQAPTEAPILVPTEVSIQAPTEAPILAPTIVPLSPPTEIPVQAPTDPPILVPTEVPVQVPTAFPHLVPTEAPPPLPTDIPTEIPLSHPTTTPFPTNIPTPTLTPTITPTGTAAPTNTPTLTVTSIATLTQTLSPTPTDTPSLTPTITPSATLTQTSTITPITPTPKWIDEKQVCGQARFANPVPVPSCEGCTGYYVFVPTNGGPVALWHSNWGVQGNSYVQIQENHYYIITNRDVAKWDKPWLSIEYGPILYHIYTTNEKEVSADQCSKSSIPQPPKPVPPPAPLTPPKPNVATPKPKKPVPPSTPLIPPKPKAITPVSSTITSTDGQVLSDGYEPGSNWLDNLWHYFIPPADAAEPDPCEYVPSDYLNKCQESLVPCNCTRYVAGLRPDVCGWTEDYMRNAYQWPTYAAIKGSNGVIVRPTPATPQAGDIVVWPPECGGVPAIPATGPCTEVRKDVYEGCGHVGYVKGVPGNGKIQIEDQNWDNHGGRRSTEIDILDCMRFISSPLEITKAPTKKLTSIVTPHPVPNTGKAPTEENQSLLSKILQWIGDFFKSFFRH
jgi:surface antigen